MRSFGSQRLNAWLWSVRQRKVKNRHERVRRRAPREKSAWQGRVAHERCCLFCGRWFWVRRRVRGTRVAIRWFDVCPACSDAVDHPLIRAFLRSAGLDGSPRTKEIAPTTPTAAVSRSRGTRR